MAPEQKKPEELTPEQWEAGREIAEFCGIGEDVLMKKMLWNGVVATVAYGLAHSARYMEDLTSEEIRTAVFGGIAEFEAALGGVDGDH